jgi:hypothetical protein
MHKSNTTIQSGHNYRHGKIDLLDSEPEGVQIWHAECRNDYLLHPSNFANVTVPSNIHIHSRIKVHGISTHTGTSIIQHPLRMGCLCKQNCVRIGIIIISDQQDTLSLQLSDSINDQYCIHVQTHIGATLISWCQHSLFHSKAQGHSKEVNATIASKKAHTHTTLFQHGIDNQFHPTTLKVGIPFRLPPTEDEDNDTAPEVVVKTSTKVPPLWLLARLALGLPGVIPGGLGDVDSMVGAARPELWQWTHTLIGHDSSFITK